jgi:hypothetical protein
MIAIHIQIMVVRVWRAFASKERKPWMMRMILAHNVSLKARYVAFGLAKH